MQDMQEQEKSAGHAGSAGIAGEKFSTYFLAPDFWGILIFLWASAISKAKPDGPVAVLGI